MFYSPGALTFGYGCTVLVGVDVGAGDVDVDIICITFIMSFEFIGRLDTVQGQGIKTSGQLKHRVQY